MPPTVSPKTSPAGTRVFDVREEVAESTLGRFHIRLAALVGCIIFFEGYDTFNAAYVIHYVTEPWGLSRGQAGLLVSTGMIGFALGALVQGRVSDRYGRRTALLSALWLVTVFSLLTATLASSFLSFCTFRVITGLGLGVLLPTGVTYLNEVAPRRVKHTFATWGWNLGFSLGGVAASLVGVFLTPVFGWEILYYAASLSILLVVVCHRWLPESVQFSALNGRQGEVVEMLSRLNPARASLYRTPGAQFEIVEETKGVARVSVLLSPENRRNTISIWVAAFFMLYAIYGLTGWVPVVMIERSGSFATSFALGGLIMMMNFFGTLGFSHFADRVHRPRRLLHFWWLGGGVTAVGLAFSGLPWIDLVGVAALGFFVLGGQGGLNNLTANWHDTAVRGTAVGMMLGMGRIGGILGPYITGVIQQFFPGPTALFLGIAVAVLIAAMTIRLVRPRRET